MTNNSKLYNASILGLLLGFGMNFYSTNLKASDSEKAKTVLEESYKLLEMPLKITVLDLMEAHIGATIDFGNMDYPLTINIAAPAGYNGEYHKVGNPQAEIVYKNDKGAKIVVSQGIIGGHYHIAVTSPEGQRAAFRRTRAGWDDLSGSADLLETLRPVAQAAWEVLNTSVDTHAAVARLG